MDSEFIGRLVRSCDEQIERILEQLSDSGMRDERTLPVSFSGRGFAARVATLAAGYLCKRSIYHRRPQVLAEAEELMEALADAANPDGTMETTASRRQDQDDTPSAVRFAVPLV